MTSDDEGARTVRAELDEVARTAPPVGFARRTKKCSASSLTRSPTIVTGTGCRVSPGANVNVPLGDHEVVFRHPELGERRQRITVRADQPARFSISLTR